MSDTWTEARLDGSTHTESLRDHDAEALAEQVVSLVCVIEAMDLAALVKMAGDGAEDVAIQGMEEVFKVFGGSGGGRSMTRLGCLIFRAVPLLEVMANGGDEASSKMIETISMAIRPAHEALRRLGTGRIDTFRRALAVKVEQAMEVGDLTAQQASDVLEIARRVIGSMEKGGA